LGSHYSCNPILVSIRKKLNAGILLVTLIVSLVSVSLAQAQATGISESAVKKALTSLRPKPSVKTQNKILNYLKSSTNPEVARGFNLLSEKNLDAKMAKAKGIISNIKIDGNISDWEASGLIQNDKEGDPAAIDNAKGWNFAPTDDIKKYCFIMDNKNAYAMVQPFQMPAAGQKYHFRINIYDGDAVKTLGNKVYSIIWTSEGNFLQKFDMKTGEFIGNFQISDAVFVKKDVFEVKMPASVLKNLPYQFVASAVTWHDFNNVYDEAYTLTSEQGINEKYAKMALPLFVKYADKIDLPVNDLTAISQALSEAYIYKRAENGLRAQVIKDGLAMIKYARNVKKFFTNQKALGEMDLDEMLTWSNRAIIYGGLGGMQYSPAKNKKFNKTAYNFMFLRPETLDKAMTLMTKNNFLKPDDLGLSLKSLQKWLVDQEKYRRENFSDIEAIHTAYKGQANWETVYQESLADKNNDQTNITTINGVSINKGAIFSPSFQVDYLLAHNYYYGNCVDAAAVALAVYKALGLPSVPFKYGTSAEGYWKEIHIFPVYYSSAANKWLQSEPYKNSVWSWANPGKPYKIGFSVIRPQIGSYWAASVIDVKGSEVWTNSREYSQFITEDAWNEVSDNGYWAEELKKVLYK